MCLICIDLAKNTITYKEAFRHLREFIMADEITENHLETVYNKIRKKKEMDPNIETTPSIKLVD